MSFQSLVSTVYFDGSCPLLSAEIDHYRRVDEQGALFFVDVAKEDASLPDGTTQDAALRRFHVRDGDGRLLTGAAAFVAVWRVLPKWRWAARVAALPGMLTALEWAYRLFLPARPLVARLFRWGVRLPFARGGAERL